MTLIFQSKHILNVHLSSFNELGIMDTKDVATCLGSVDWNWIVEAFGSTILTKKGNYRTLFIVVPDISLIFGPLKCYAQLSPKTTAEVLIINISKPLIKWIGNVIIAYKAHNRIAYSSSRALVWRCANLALMDLKARKWPFGLRKFLKVSK